MAKTGKLMIIQGEPKGLSCLVKDGEEASIGRNLECSLPVPDIRLSRIHCIVRNNGGEFELLDNNSSNGTFMNGKKIDLFCPICPGDTIEIGDTAISFDCE